MDALRKHFKLHGMVHSFWLITLLILLISALLIRVPNGERVNAYISFASSLSSLLLAVVAIFYSFISNENVSHATYAMQHSVDDIKSSSEKISLSADDISAKAEQIRTDINDIRPTVEDIHERMSASAPSITSDVPDRHLESATSPINPAGLIKVRPSAGLIVALYTLAKAKKLNISRISPADLYHDVPQWHNYIDGVCATIVTTIPGDIEIDFLLEESKAYFIIRKIPDDIVDEIIRYIESHDYSGKENHMTRVNNYLASVI